jgi:hypothetical protein
MSYTEKIATGKKHSTPASTLNCESVNQHRSTATVKAPEKKPDYCSECLKVLSYAKKDAMTIFTLAEENNALLRENLDLRKSYIKLRKDYDELLSCITVQQGISSCHN